MSHEGRIALIVTLLIAVMMLVWTQGSAPGVQARGNAQASSPTTIGAAKAAARAPYKAMLHGTATFMAIQTGHHQE